MADDKNTAPSANTGDGSSGKVGAWTDAERSQLLLRVLATLLPDGKGVEWKNINMPNRTTKALQGQWTTIIAQMRDLNMGGDGVTVPKPRSRKKTATKQSAAADDDDGDNNEDDDEGVEDKKPITPKKRGAAATAGGSAKKRRTPAKKSASKVKAEDQEDDDDKSEVKSEVKNDEI